MHVVLKELIPALPAAAQLEGHLPLWCNADEIPDRQFHQEFAGMWSRIPERETWKSLPGRTARSRIDNNVTKYSRK
jgi:hypothetical protein